MLKIIIAIKIIAKWQLRELQDGWEDVLIQGIIVGL